MIWGLFLLTDFSCAYVTFSCFFAWLVTFYCKLLCNSHCCQYAEETQDYVIFLWRAFGLVLVAHLPGWTQAPVLFTCRGQQLPPLLSFLCPILLLFFTGILGTVPMDAVRSQPKIWRGFTHRFDGLTVCNSSVLEIFVLYPPASVSLSQWGCSFLPFLAAPNHISQLCPPAKSCTHESSLLQFHSFKGCLYLSLCLFNAFRYLQLVFYIIFPESIIIIYGRVTLI